MQNNFVVLKSNANAVGVYPFSAYLAKDHTEIEAQLDLGKLNEGDLVLEIKAQEWIVKQNPLKLQRYLD